MEVHVAHTGGAIGGKERLALANLLLSLGGVEEPLLLQCEHPGGEVLGSHRLPALQVMVIDQQGYQEADQPAVGAGNALLVRHLAGGLELGGVLLRCAGVEQGRVLLVLHHQGLADQGCHVVLEVGRRDTLPRGIDRGIRIEHAVGHQGVNEVADHHRNWSEAAEPVMERLLFLLSTALRERCVSARKNNGDAFKGGPGVSCCL